MTRGGDRPIGVSSRLRPAHGRANTWLAPNGSEVSLPVVVDIVRTNSDGTTAWSVEATVQLVGEEPEVTEVHVQGSRGLDLVHLQKTFRWATPLDVVRRTVPELLAAGQDPYAHEYATTGYPSAAALHRRRSELTDAFLEEIAREYLVRGRGYAAAISFERGVSSRTVIGWIEKARARGILTGRGKGAHGGEIIPAAERPPC